MGADIPDGWLDNLRGFVASFPKTIDEIDRVVTKNGIWVGRTIGLELADTKVYASGAVRLTYRTIRI